MRMIHGFRQIFVAVHRLCPLAIVKVCATPRNEMNDLQSKQK